MVLLFGNFGVSFATIRLTSEELAIGNYEGIKKTTKHCIFISFICSIIASFLFILFSDFIINSCLHGKVDKNVIFSICFALPFISMSSAISGYFVAVRRVYKTTVAQFFEQIIKIIFTAFLLNLFLPKGLEYACFSLILGDLISEIFSFVCHYVLYKFDSKKYKTSYITYNSSNFYNKKIFRIATPIALTSLVRSGLSTLKQILIPISFEKGRMDCKKALSIYGEINGMAMPVVAFSNVIFSSISSLLIPELSAYNAQQNNKGIKKIIKKSLIISIILSFFISFFLFLFSDKLGILIYKETSISYYIKILSPMAFLIMLDCVIDNILKGLDAQNQVMIINIIDLFIDIILIYFIVPKLEIKGYLFSMYCSEIVNLILSFSILIKIYATKRTFYKLQKIKLIEKSAYFVFLFIFHIFVCCI